MRPLVILGLCLGGLSPLALAAPRPFTARDLQAMERISDPVACPDGTGVLYTLRRTDWEADRGRTDLWFAPLDGSGPRRLTTAPGADTGGRWSPDGRRIWFLSDRSGSMQIWSLARGGGEAEPVTELPLDLANLVVGPRGRFLAFTAEVFPDANLAETRARLDARAARQASGRVYDRIFVRHWDTWKDGRRSHLFVLPAEGGAARDLMAGWDADTPSKPFGGPEEITFAPEGREVVFSARVAGPNEPWSTNFDLFAVPVDGSAPPRNLTPDNPAWDTQPVFSPDGRTLAYLAMARPGYESDRRRIVLQDWPDGRPRVLTEAWDRSPGGLIWSADGRSLYAVAADRGRTPLFSVDVRDGRVRPVLDEGTVHAVTRAGDVLVISQSSLRAPAELFRLDARGRGHRALTGHNRARVAEIAWGAVEPFSFPGWNDETVHGFVVRPADFRPGRTYPVAFLIHGGPQGSFSDRFHYRWNPQVYAGAGYAVVSVDFHGSTGYGQAFTDSIRGDWGGKPLEDLRKGLAAALARCPWMDGSRVGALGASFGGYMINWIAGQWPDRFRCLVNHDGNLDERMAYYDTEELWFPEWDHEGTPWANPSGYEKHNPVNHVGRWRTPMLVIHGGRDFRVADTQGLGTFNALQRRGIPSRLLYFPDESHWVLKPANALLWHETVLDWLDRWLKQGGGVGGALGDSGCEISDFKSQIRRPQGGAVVD